MSLDRKPASFSDIIAPLPGTICSVALKLRDVIQASMPDADEAIGGGGKIGMALYSIGGPNNVVCGIQPTSGDCKLFFHGWRSLVENGFLLEGSGKHARHIKIRSLADLERVDVKRMVYISRSALGL